MQLSWRLWIFLSLAALCFAEAAVATNVSKLNVYNWSGYLPDEVLKQFQQETGIYVNYSTFDSNETLYAKLKTNPNGSYDVVVPSTYFVDRMIREGMLRKLDNRRLQGLHHLDPQLMNKPYDPHNHYSLPYLWSTTGIVVNTRYCYGQSLPNTWRALWEKRYRNRLLLLDDVREVFSVALLSLHLSPNTRDRRDIQRAYEWLRQLMPNIRLFGSEAIESLYVDDDLTVGMGWNGEIFRAQQENPALQFIYPQEGYILSIDSLVIPLGARHVDNAYRFISFLLRPDIAAKVSHATGYASPNRDAYRYLSPSLLANPMIYPDAATLDRGTTQTDVGEAAALYEYYWERLKIGG